MSEINLAIQSGIIGMCYQLKATGGGGGEFEKICFANWHLLPDARAQPIAPQSAWFVVKLKLTIANLIN